MVHLHGMYTWIFASVKLFPPVNSTFQVSLFFSIMFMVSSYILYTLWHFILQLFGTISCDFLYAILTIDRFFVSSSSRGVYVDQCTVVLQCFLFTLGIFSVWWGTFHGLLTSRKSPLFLPLVFSIPSVGTIWVCSCLGRFFCVGGSESMWPFICSSTHVCLHLSFPVCYGWKWIFEPESMYATMVRGFLI